MLIPWKESCDQPRQHIKKQRRYFVRKGRSNQGYGFSSCHVWMWELDYKESWVPNIDAFELWYWRILLRVTWTARSSNQSILKENSPGCSMEGQMLKLKVQYFGYLMQTADSLKRPWCWERLRAGGEGDNRGWDGWMASLTQWLWVWVGSKVWTQLSGWTELKSEWRLPELWSSRCCHLLWWWLETWRNARSSMYHSLEWTRKQDLPPDSWVSNLVVPDSSDPMDFKLLCSSVHGILQARILEGVVISLSRGSSQPKDQTQVSCIAGRFFTIWATKQAPDSWGAYGRNEFSEPRDLHLPIHRMLNSLTWYLIFDVQTVYFLCCKFVHSLTSAPASLEQFSQSYCDAVSQARSLIHSHWKNDSLLSGCDYMF